MGLGGVAIATLPSVIFPKLMFSDRLGGISKYRRPSVIISKRYHKIDTSLSFG